MGDWPSGGVDGLELEALLIEALEHAGDGDDVAGADGAATGRKRPRTDDLPPTSEARSSGDTAPSSPSSSSPSSPATSSPPSPSSPSSPSSLSHLPTDCLEKIVSHVAPADLLSLSQVSTQFRLLASSQALWRSHYYQRWPSGKTVLDGIKLASDETDGVVIPSWKALYLLEDAEELRGLRSSDALFVAMAKGHRLASLRDASGRWEEVCVVWESARVLEGGLWRGVGGEVVGAVGDVGAAGLAEHVCAYERVAATAYGSYASYVCRGCGVAHRCDGGCAYLVRSGEEEVCCTLTGAVRGVEFVDGEGGGGGEGEWDRRVLYAAGYNADEGEMERMGFLEGR